MVYSNNKTVVESTDILKGVASNGSIYEFCDTFAEGAFALCAFAEGAYTELFESIGCNELAFYESTGRELDYVSEAEEEKKAGEGIKGFFIKIWGAIKAAYEKVIAWIDKNVKDFIDTVKENGVKDINANWGKIKGSIADDKSFGKFSFDIITMKKQVGIKAKTWCQNSNSFAKHDGANTDDIYKVVFGYDSVKSISELQKAIRKDLTLETAENVDKAFIDKNLKDLTDIVMRGTCKNFIKEQYNAQKKSINEFIKDNESIKNKSENLKNKISLAKNTVNVTNAALMTLLDIDKKFYVSCRNILIAVLRTLQKSKDYEKAENRSKFKGTKLKDVEVKPKNEAAKENDEEEDEKEKDLVEESINALFAW
jgi:hypothetical protein